MEFLGGDSLRTTRITRPAWRAPARFAGTLKGVGRVWNTTGIHWQGHREYPLRPALPMLLLRSH